MFNSIETHRVPSTDLPPADWAVRDVRSCGVEFVVEFAPRDVSIHRSFQQRVEGIPVFDQNGIRVLHWSTPADKRGRCHSVDHYSLLQYEFDFGWGMWPLKIDIGVSADGRNSLDITRHGEFWYGVYRGVKWVWYQFGPVSQEALRAAGIVPAEPDTMGACRRPTFPGEDGPHDNILQFN